MISEFIDFLRNSKKYGFFAVVRDLININKLYLQKSYVNKVLKFAEENDMKFTFFFTAKKLDKKMPLIKRILADGHEIGSHGYNHIALGRRNYETIFRELKRADIEFKKHGINVVGFRAPFLSINENVIEVIRRLGYKYSSNSYTKTNNKVKEANIIAPYDWEGLIAYGLSLEELFKKWKGKEGVFLLHPWVFANKLELFKKEILKKGGDYRIKSGNKISVSFDVY